MQPSDVGVNEQAPISLIGLLKLLKISYVVAWPFLVSLSLVFVVTFVVFPGVSLHTYIHSM